MISALFTTKPKPKSALGSGEMAVQAWGSEFGPQMWKHTFSATAAGSLKWKLLVLRRQFEEKQQERIGVRVCLNRTNKRKGRIWGAL